MLNGVKSKFRKARRGAIVTPKCGHNCRKVYMIDVYRAYSDKPEKTEIIFSNSHAFCVKCFKKRLIRCAICGKTIYPLQGVNLVKTQKLSHIPKYAYVHKDFCLICNCAECAGGVKEARKRSGCWDGKKFIPD